MLDVVPSTKVCRGKCGRDLPLDAFGVQKRGLYGRKSECLACLAEKEAVRRACNPEAHREYKRRWWARNPRTETQKKAATLRFKAWYAQNKGRHRATMQRWVRENQAAFKEIQKRYLVKNPVHVRRARHMAAVERTLTQEQWNGILELFGQRCAYCLAETKLTMDHVIPVSRGGPHIAGNVVPACKSCNSKKGARNLFYMLSSRAA
jgi:5-methylcytosine-specific restriction endonuclease McrA